MREETIFKGRWPYKTIQMPEKKAQEHFNKAKLLAIQGKNEKAIKEYEKALQIEPTYKQAQVNLDFLRWWTGPLKKLKD